MVLRPFAPPPLRGFFANTASADFSSALTEEISPGKVQTLFPRAVWLYLMRLDDFWASLYRASLPPAPGLTASSCSYGREFASRFFRLSPRGCALRFGYGCRHRPRLAPFIQLDSAHAGHTPQPPFRRPSRLKAGCGQNCPPHNPAPPVAGLTSDF